MATRTSHTPRYCFWSENPATLSEEEKLLISKMRVLTDDELLSCLEVPVEEVMDSLHREVSCVTCRKAAKLRATPGRDSMAKVVSPISIDDDGWVRIDKELAKVDYYGLLHQRRMKTFPFHF